MSLSTTLVVGIVIFMPISFVANQEISKDYPINTILHRILEKINKILLYYKSNLENFNLDGIFGLKVFEGSVNSIFYETDISVLSYFQYDSDLDKHFGDYNNFYQEFARLFELSKSLSVKAVPFLKSQNSKYYEQFRSLVINIWKPVSFMRQVDTSISPEIKSNSKKLVIDEALSDFCLAQLLEKDKTKGDCDLSSICTENFIHLYYLHEYQATHQLLYLIIADQTYCKQHINSLLQQKGLMINSLQRILCSRIFKEVNSNNPYKTQSTTIDPEDLFLEQSFLCSTIGFWEFLNLKHLSFVLNLISKEGCLKHNLPSESPNRKLLEEKELKNGCLTHKTSLGLALLSTYLRWLFDYNTLENKKLVRERIMFSRRFLPDVLEMNQSEVPRYDWVPYFISNKSADQQDSHFDRVSDYVIDQLNLTNYLTQQNNIDMGLVNNEPINNKHLLNLQIGSFLVCYFLVIFYWLIKTTGFKMWAGKLFKF